MLKVQVGILICISSADFLFFAVTNLRHYFQTGWNFYLFYCRVNHFTTVPSKL